MLFFVEGTTNRKPIRYYAYNALTRSWIAVPPPPEEVDGVPSTSTTIAVYFNEEKGEFRILFVLRDENAANGPGELAVHSLGTDTWRRVGRCPPLGGGGGGVYIEGPCIVNGRIHWINVSEGNRPLPSSSCLDGDGGEINVFDLEEEGFSQISAPKAAGGGRLCLFKMEEKLCLSQVVRRKEMVVWALEGCRSWAKLFIISVPGECVPHEYLFIHKPLMAQGGVLFLREYGHVLSHESLESYDVGTGTMKVYIDFEEWYFDPGPFSGSLSLAVLAGSGTGRYPFRA